MTGYDPQFLGLHLPLPNFRPERAGLLVRSAQLVNELVAGYPNYAVVMDKQRRAPAFAVLHIDQAQIKDVPRSDNWRIDSRVGAEHQLDNDYYANNPYDRGHMARRASCAWGPTLNAAKKASDETFYYTNATMQHANLNQDEWLALEEWVLSLQLARDGKITVFAGPIFGDLVRTIRPVGRPPADIPSGFFKVVCFVNRNTAQLDVRAFIVLQDDAAIRNKQGRKLFSFQHYQVTIREIEQCTGMDFADEIYEANPLYFYRNEEAALRLGISSFPERVDVNGAEDIVSADTPRVVVADDAVEVYIAAAMVDPAEEEMDGEWISLLSLEPATVDLLGWRLVDHLGREKQLEGHLLPGQARSFKGATGLHPVRLPNSGGRITLFRADGHRVDRVDYTSKDLRRGRTTTGRSLPICFLTYRNL